MMIFAIFCPLLYKYAENSNNNVYDLQQLSSRGKRGIRRRARGVPKGCLAHTDRFD